MITFRPIFLTSPSITDTGGDLFALNIQVWVHTTTNNQESGMVTSLHNVRDMKCPPSLATKFDPCTPYIHQPSLSTIIRV